MPKPAMLTIKTDLDPQQAKAVCVQCTDAIAQAGPLAVEFDGKSPNIFALQIALSCRRTLQNLDHFDGFGPIAQQVLGDMLKMEHTLKATV